MSYTIKKTGGSNKPSPPTPLPEPPIYLPTKPIQGPWGSREAWVSVPLPDRLAFTVKLGPKVYAAGVGQLASTDAFWTAAYSYLLSEVGAAYGVLCEKNSKAKGSPFQLHLGERGSTVSIFKYGDRLGLECNPRKLGLAGFELLTLILGDLFDLKEMNAASRLTRLDAAIDIVGVDIAEIVARHTDGGKRRMYVGRDSKLETVYLNAKKGSKAMRAVLYDRHRLALDKKKKPPFGEAPVTRIEVVSTNIGKNEWPLSRLPTLPDRFAKVRAGFWHTQTDKHAWVEQFLTYRRTMSSVRAAELLGSAATPSFMEAMKLLETVPEADFVSNGVNWATWPQGLKATGLQHLLDACAA